MPKPPTTSDLATAAVGICLRDLAAQGTTLRAWAIGKGYQPGTAYAVARRWSYRIRTEPHGGIARALMADLRASLSPAALRALEPGALSHAARRTAAIRAAIPEAA